MDKPDTGSPRTHGYRIVALLLLFVAAAILALLGRLVPGALPRLKTGVTSRLQGHRRR